VLGGIASGGEHPGQNRLIFDGQVLRSGAVGAALWGDVVLDTVVSQGCRPIGKHLEVTKAEAHVIQELAGRSPLKVLMEVLREARPRDVELARTRGLLVGRQIAEPGPQGHDAYLIRTPVGFDQDSGALALNDYVKPGQTIRFHVRDDASAGAELTELLEQQHARPAAGALMFTCNGRGTRLFQHKHHDARAVADACDALPLAGFFAAGEIGPVSTRNFLHGHTACIGFLRPAGGAAPPR
jgi:small ligand-binding sensory domain FIST